MTQAKDIFRVGVALFAAPAAVVIPSTLVFVAASALAHWPPGAASQTEPNSVLDLIAAIYAFVARISVPAGGLTWLAFQFAGIEKVGAYALAGAGEGFIWAALTGCEGIASLICASIGGAIAVAFWIISRKTSAAVQQSQTERPLNSHSVRSK